MFLPSGKCANLSWKLKRLPTPWFDYVGKNDIKPQRKEPRWESLLRTVKKRKKVRRLGEVEVVNREGYADLDVDSKVEMIQALVPLGLMHVHELLDDEVKELAGERYARKEESASGRRHGTNPGTVATLARLHYVQALNVLLALFESTLNTNSNIACTRSCLNANAILFGADYVGIPHP